MAEHSNGAYNLFTIHEDRIQKLEEDRAFSMSQLTKQTVLLESFKDEVCDKLDSLNSTMISLVGNVATNTNQIESLEKQETKGDERRVYWRGVAVKVFLGVCTTALGYISALLIK